VDGLIAIGEGDVDESLLTGEPKPVTHREGDAVQSRDDQPGRQF
jgi:cation transport ATPase